MKVRICLRSADAAISSTVRWTIGALNFEWQTVLCAERVGVCSVCILGSHSIVCGQRSKPMRPKWERAQKKKCL